MILYLLQRTCTSSSSFSRSLSNSAVFPLFSFAIADSGGGGYADNPVAVPNENQWLPSLLYGDATFDPANPLLLESHPVGDVVAD